jgi:hypothetical protein
MNKNELTLAPATSARPDDQGLFSLEETLAVSRKKTLLTLLALREAKRQGVDLDESSVDRMAAWFRATFGLTSDQEFQRWLEQSGQTAEAFRAAMRGLVAVAELERRLASEIGAGLSMTRAVWTAHAWKRATKCDM